MPTEILASSHATNEHQTNSLVKFELFESDAIAVITLNDPERGNAMSREMGDAFSAALSKVKYLPSVRVVIVRGAGKDFSIGGDRDMLIHLGDGSLDEKSRREFMMAFYDLWLPLLYVDVPTIAVIQGECIGVAPVFACISDIAIAEEGAKFHVTFAALGLYPGMALPQLLPETIGRQRSAVLMMSGQALSGGDASQIGLVAQAVANGTGFERALEIAKGIINNAPQTVKELVKHLRIKREDLLETLKQNAKQQASDFATEEYQRRIANYLPAHYNK